VLEEKKQNACVQEKVVNMHLAKHANIAENHVIPEELVNRFNINIHFFSMKNILLNNQTIYFNSKT
jgi:hypothetical protein